MHTKLTSTATVAKKRIKHGLQLNSDLMSCEMTEDEKTKGQPVLFFSPVCQFHLVSDVYIMKKHTAGFFFFFLVHSVVKQCLSQ